MTSTLTLYIYWMKFNIKKYRNIKKLKRDLQCNVIFLKYENFYYIII